MNMIHRGETLGGRELLVLDRWLIQRAVLVEDTLLASLFLALDDDAGLLALEAVSAGDEHDLAAERRWIVVDL